MWRLDAQEVREGTAVTRRFHGIMQGLVDGMRRQRPAESSIAAHLLDIKDPKTGALAAQRRRCTAGAAKA